MFGFEASQARVLAATAHEVAEKHEDEGVRYLATAVEELATLVTTMAERLS